jgi:hypothetical protein
MGKSILDLRLRGDISKKGLVKAEKQGKRQRAKVKSQKLNAPCPDMIAELIPSGEWAYY